MSYEAVNGQRGRGAPLLLRLLPPLYKNLGLPRKLIIFNITLERSLQNAITCFCFRTVLALAIESQLTVFL